MIDKDYKSAFSSTAFIWSSTAFVFIVDVVYTVDVLFSLLIFYVCMFNFVNVCVCAYQCICVCVFVNACMCLYIYLFLCVHALILCVHGLSIIAYVHLRVCFARYVTYLFKTSCKSQNSVSRCWAKTLWEAFFPIDTLLQILILIYLFYMRNLKI